MHSILKKAHKLFSIYKLNFGGIFRETFSVSLEKDLIFQFHLIHIYYVYIQAI